jgi:two-component system response regulator NreC
MKTSIFIFSINHLLIGKGLLSILHSRKDLRDSELIQSLDMLDEEIDNKKTSILICYQNKYDLSFLNHIKERQRKFNKLQILLVAMEFDRDFIFESIKSGVKGLLTAGASDSELQEAVLALKSGYDYFSNILTDYILKKHSSDLDSRMSPTEKESLSVRELEILQLWGNSFSNMVIADKLCISVRTVESHKNHIMQKLNLKTTVDLLKFAIKNNLVSLE